MNKLDLLLKLDKKKLVRPTKEVEIKRLSEILGEPFIVVCQALSPDEFEEIQDSVKVNTNGEIETGENLQASYVVKGVKDPNFKDQKVIEHFGAINAAEAVANIFLPGEVSGLFNVINELSGFGKDAVAEIKKESAQTGK